MASDYTGSNLLLVVGSPRSGTTWVQRLLAGHPQIKTGQESDVFDTYIAPQLRAWQQELKPEASGRGGVGLGAYFTDEQFQALLRDYMLKLLEPMIGSLKPGMLFLEKTPSHALFIREIHTLLPEARFIHVLRDGRDVAASIMAASKSWGSGWAKRRPGDAAGMWVQHVQAAREAGRELPPSLFTEVRYEELHSRGPQVLRNLVDWLGLEWTDEEIRKALADNNPDTARAGGGTAIPLGGQFGAASGGQVKEPEGFVRRAQAGGWEQDLSRVERVFVWRVARRLMAQTGYPWPSPFSS